jgi:hydrogenase maturation protease
VKTIIIGLGNPILGDDGVGCVVAQEISKLALFVSGSVVVECLSAGGLTLMESLAGYHRAILVDAVQTGLHRPGTVIQLPLDDLPEQASSHMISAHDASLKTALQLGHEMGVQLPKQIIVVGIEAEQVYDFSDTLSSRISEAIPEAVQVVCNLLIQPD